MNSKYETVEVQLLDNGTIVIKPTDGNYRDNKKMFVSSVNGHGVSYRCRRCIVDKYLDKLVEELESKCVK